MYSRGLFENIAHLFPDKRQKHVRVLFGDFNVHHKIPLDFFSGIAYTDSEETHVSVFRAEAGRIVAAWRARVPIAAYGSGNGRESPAIIMPPIPR